MELPEGNSKGKFPNKWDNKGKLQIWKEKILNEPNFHLSTLFLAHPY